MIEVLSQGSFVMAISQLVGKMAAMRIMVLRVLTLLPVAAGFDRRSEPDQGGFLEVPPDQHQPDR
jgi:hypothetical protein